MRIIYVFVDQLLRPLRRGRFLLVSGGGHNVMSKFPFVAVMLLLITFGVILLVFH